MIFASIAIAIKLSSAIILTDCRQVTQVLNMEYSYSYSVNIFNWIVAINCDFSVLNVLLSVLVGILEIQDNCEKYAGNYSNIYEMNAGP